MSLTRNLARLLRGDGGLWSADVLLSALLTTALAVAALSFTATRSLAAAGTSLVLALPVQLAALTRAQTARALTVVGSILVAWATASSVHLIVDFLRLLDSPALGWLVSLWVAAPVAGLVWVGFTKGGSELRRAGWY